MARKDDRPRSCGCPTGHIYLLLAIIVSAFALRASGLGWGLPDGTLPAHRSSNRGDENAILQDTLAVLRTLRGSATTLKEHSFYMQEGWLGSYLRLGFLGGAYLTGYIRFDDFDDREIGGYDLLNFRRVFLVSRLVSVMAAAGTIGLVYIAGKKHWGRWQGLAAALLLAILPGHVVLSRFAKSNALAALLTTASLYYALAWHKAPSRRSALLAGACAGLAAGARTNAALSILAFIIAVALRWRATSRRLRLSSAALAAAGLLAAAALCYPHLIANPRLPDYGVGNIWYLGFKWKTFGQGLWQVMGGWPGILLLVIGSALGVVQAMQGRDMAYLIMACWSALYCVFIAKTAVPQPRYFIPLTPTLALQAGAGIAWGIRAIRPRKLAWLIGLATASLILLTTAFTIAYVNVFTTQDTKVTAGHWLASNAPPGSVIGKAYWEGDHRVPVDTQTYEVIYSQPHPDWPGIAVIDEHGSPQPDFIAISEEHIPRNRFDMREYEPVATIERPLTAFGLTFDDRFPLSDPYAPRWHSKFHATVYIYQHQRSAIATGPSPRTGARRGLAGG